jgi:hypothetical protein
MRVVPEASKATIPPEASVDQEFEFGISSGITDQGTTTDDDGFAVVGRGRHSEFVSVIGTVSYLSVAF